VEGTSADASARIENAILCSNVRIGEKAAIKDCEFGTGFEALPGGKPIRPNWRDVLTCSCAQGREIGRWTGGVGVDHLFVSSCISARRLCRCRDVEISSLPIEHLESPSGPSRPSRASSTLARRP
jgi:hypothetical protein